MGKTARAASRQYDIHGRAGDKSCKPFQIAGASRAHMMMCAKKIVAKLDMLRQPAWSCVSGMEQQELGRGRHLAFEKAPLERMQRNTLVGACDQHDAIGLTQAEIRPGAVGLIALIEDHVMFGFETIEPVRRFVAGRTVEHRGLGAHIDQYLRHAPHDRIAAKPALQRNHGKGLGLIALMPAARRLPQAANHDLQQIEHDAGIARQQHVEGFGPETQEFRVAQGYQRRRVGFTGQERHFPHGFSGRDGGNQPLWRILIGDEHAERARDDQEHRAIVLTVSRQLRSAGEPEPIGFRKQPAQRGIADLVQKAEILQPLFQRFGEKRFTAATERGKQGHFDRSCDTGSHPTKPSIRRPPSTPRP